MMKLTKPFIFTCLLFASYMSTFAAVHLELTQGIDAAYPIAIVPFADKSGDALANQLSDVIRQDLYNSGQFRPLGTSDMPAFPHTAMQISRTQWKSSGVNAIVFGKIEPLGGDRYRVSVGLSNIYPHAKQSNLTLWQQTFTSTAAQFHGLAHHIADQIYQKLIGERGIFSTKIAYVLITGQGRQKRYHLQLADYDGFSPQTIVDSKYSIMSPAWSPNGKKIAYVSFEQGKPGIWINDLASGKRTLVSREPGINGAPAWSPGGKTLALVLSKDGYPNIYIKNLRTGQLRQLTRGSAIDTEPTYSPDGKFIYFTSDRGGQPQIYRINLRTQKINRVTFEGRYNARPSLTHNGRELVTLHKGEQGSFSIALDHLNTNQWAVLATEDYAQSPSVAPNGKMVVYSIKLEGDHYILAIASSDGKVQWRLPSQEGSVREPAWGPFLS